MKKVLITGASGFLGGYLVDEALSRGYDVTAGIRETSSKRYLQDPRIQFLVLDFANPRKLREQLAGHQFDVVVHNAGITKADRKEDFYTVNFEYTKRFVESLKATGALKGRFLYMSSLAAAGPGDPEKQQKIRIDDPPRPVTTYGKSKLASEAYLQGLDDFPFVIFRPTVVYGPRETELFTLFKVIKGHLEPYIGFSEQALTFVFVTDLAKVICNAFTADVLGRSFFIADGNFYPSRQVNRMIKQELGTWTVPVKVPVPLVRAIAWLAEKASAPFGKYPAFNLEKVNELECLNWQCDATPIRQQLDFQPEFELEKGIAETVSWYRKESWL